jgi:hypothetical protein
MTDYECDRCGFFYKSKRTLLDHLKKPNVCMPIKNDIDRSNILFELLDKKEGVSCKFCSKKFKNNFTLGRHKKVCNNANNICNILDLREELKEELRAELKEELKQMQTKLNQLTTAVDKPTIQNINNNVTNNNLNVTLNCIMDVSGKSIEYILNSDNFKDKIIGWMRENKGIYDYIDEKFYNSDHPENWLIKKGDNDNEIKLHMLGKWKKLDNEKATDMILVNVGNDFMRYIDELREDDIYRDNINVIKKFDKTIMSPLDWGIDISEDELQQKTIVQNEQGKYVYLEDVKEQKEKDKITKKVIKHIHNKD